MKLIELHIKRNASYESNPNQLVGMIHLEGQLGKIAIPIDAKELSEIFKIVRLMAIANTHLAAQAASRAMEDVIHEPFATEASDNITKIEA